ncbi:hypothetical protein BDY24DRAFT_261855 [Mrakia frigida]|uniref:uncharacterized protein n=1 Tax=Mrakia frigida TaxID=29902 RepID=UPI003FCBF26C
MADDQGSLVVCARVCKQWSLLALQTLWGSRPIWASQLVSIFPDDAKSDAPFGFSRAGVNPLRNQKFIMRVPTSSELERCQLYASLIKHLRFDESDALHPYVLGRLSFDGLETLECQPLLDTETILTLGPLCGPSIKRCLLLLDDPEDDEDSEDEEDPDEDLDEEARYHHYDSALTFSIIDYVARMSYNISVLDLAVGPKTSSAFLGLLEPLRDSLRSLTLFVRNRSISTERTNPFPLENLYQLDGFNSLQKLSITVESISPAPNVGSYPRLLDLPALNYFQASALSSEQLCDVLPLVPSTITTLLLHDLSLVPNVGKREAAREFVTALNRFENLERFQLLSPAFQAGTQGNRKAYIPALTGLIATMKRLRVLEVAHPSLRFPSTALALLAKSLPDLRELALLTDDLRISHLKKLQKEAPLLRRLAVAPYIRNDMEVNADWTWRFNALERFGGLFTRQESLRSPGAMSVQKLIEEQSSFLHVFPITCRFGDQDPLVDFFDEESKLYQFQRSAAEGGPEGEEGEEDGSESDSDSDQDMDEEEVAESDDQLDDEVSTENEDSGWVDED